METRSEQPLEVIDAFVDGERVDAAAMKAALADADGRDYFVDAWILRESVRIDRAADIPIALPVRPARFTPWLAAAVFAGAVGIGYAIGHLTSGVVPPAPGQAPGVAVTAAAPPAGAFPVPAATRVIQLEFRQSPTANGGD